ncbi:hypothetical protein [Solidesulfovibrio carbinolicus]|uniref:Protease HtpX n=1 Tax=Solidesulfovibrio carbinolicus TaxID=296842 RepID=A0A4V0YQF8_9BACT|nr:hypothetical protein [Solidesulfovibrio carbinolicus]QAZ66152.1 hypothetical protein C3Y92_02410 [Solidesulfovibrio carbinolicus]
MTSRFKTVLLLGLLTGLILLIEQMVGGKEGLFIAIALVLAMNVGSYWFSDRIVLSMYNAQGVAPHDAPVHLFIVNPFSASRFDSLFNTHPSLKERIGRLEGVARLL